jgi:dienelactone hydrolase
MRRPSPRLATASALATLALTTPACDAPRAPGGPSASAPSSASSAPLASGVPSASSSSSSGPTPSTTTNTMSRAERARALTHELGRGNYAGALRHADPGLVKALSESDLARAWEQSVGKAGSFAGVERITSLGTRERERVTVVAKLERGTIDVLLGFGASDLPSSLYLRPAKPSYSPPSYADPSKLEERAVTLGAGDAAIGATLTLPKGAGPFPVVIMLAGSGPQDRDATMAAARPLRDLALGLATLGVASLRWDKRVTDPVALTALVPLADATVEHEYLHDASLAIALAESTSGLDPARVFVLGHSQGGWLVPWIMERHPKVAGGVLLAGCARHFNAIVPSQLEYLAKLDDGVVGPLEALQIGKVREQCERAKRKDLSPDTPASELPLGVPAKYWIAIRDYDAVATAKRNGRPLLALQGGRDYQVTPADDLAMWRAALAGKKGSSWKLYPTLNHAFIAGEGRIEPREYLELSGHLAEEVVRDVAKWVQGGG